MKRQHALIRRVAEVHELLTLSTPQATDTIKKAAYLLQKQEPPPPILYITGRSGSGVSTVAQGIYLSLRTDDGGVFIMPQTGVDPGLPPIARLLRHFGFECTYEVLEVSAMNQLPAPVMNLAQMLGFSVVVVEDYLTGVASPEQKRRHIDQWKKLTAFPLNLKLVLAAPLDQVKHSWDNQESTLEHLHINEWERGNLLSSYLDDLSSLCRETLRLDAPFSNHMKEIHKLSKGNTAHMLIHIRQCAIHSILSNVSHIPSELFRLSLKELTESNARLYSQLTSV